MRDSSRDETRLDQLEGELDWEKGRLEELRNEDAPGGCVDMEICKERIAEVEAEIKLIQDRLNRT